MDVAFVEPGATFLQVYVLGNFNCMFLNLNVGFWVFLCVVELLTEKIWCTPDFVFAAVVAPPISRLAYRVS